MSESVASELTVGRLLVRNTLWNLVGLGAPLIVAVFAIPLLIDGLGLERFGVLALAWMVVGYFSLFDLGLGRALTKLVAEKLGAGQNADIPPLAWTALLLMLLLGAIGALVVGLLCPWLVSRALRIPEALQIETLYAFYTLALSIPILVSTAGLRGILEAQQRFGIVTALRIPLGVFTFLGPVCVLPFSNSIYPIAVVLVAGRLLAWLAHLLICLRVTPTLRQNFVLKRAMVGPLLRFGGWMTVTNIVSPFMAYLDRFLIGALISLTAVAYYVTPFEMITKLLVIPAALVGVLFPAFSSTFFQDLDRAALFYYRGIKYLFLTMFPITLIVVVFAQEILHIWLGADFADNSFRVLQLIGIGVLMNGVANVPFAFIQGAGRPDVTGKLNFIELPFYLVAVVLLTNRYGILGTAIAWVLRVTIDALVLMIVAQRFLHDRRYERNQVSLFLLWMVLSFGLALLTLPVAIKVGLLVISLIIYSRVVWTTLSDIDIRPFKNRMTENTLRNSHVKR